MKKIMFVFVVIAMVSCDCFTQFKAVIVDAQTHEPLDSVMIINTNEKF